MTEPTTALATPTQATKKSLLLDMANEVGLEHKAYYAAVQKAAGCEGASDTDFMVLLLAARAYNLNPIAGEIVLANNKGKVRAIVPIDGRAALMRRHPDYVAHSIDFEWAPGTPKTRESAIKGNLWSATCRVWTKSRMAAKLPPAEHTEFFSECYVEPRQKRDGSGAASGPWQSHPIRMLGWKALNQAQREFFGLSIPDADEAERIADAQVRTEAEIVDTTPAIPIPALTGADPQRESRAPVEAPFSAGDGSNPGAEGPLPSSQGAGESATGSVRVPEGSISPDASGSSPRPGDEPFDEAESLRLDAQTAPPTRTGDSLFGEAP